MVDKCMTFVSCALGSIIPDCRRNSISLGKLREILEVVLLESLLAQSLTVYASELSEIYRDAF